MMKLEDRKRDPALLKTEMEDIFQNQYLANLTGSPQFVCLESENFVNMLAMDHANPDLQECTSLANVVWPFLKRPLMHFLEMSFPSCCYLCRKTIWSST